MNKKLFVIHDQKAAYHMPPMVFRTHGEAERWFSQVVNEQEHPISKQPEDFRLKCIGEYEEREGKVIPQSHQVVADGMAFKRQSIDKMEKEG